MHFFHRSLVPRFKNSLRNKFIKCPTLSSFASPIFMANCSRLINSLRFVSEDSSISMRNNVSSAVVLPSNSVSLLNQRSQISFRIIENVCEIHPTAFCLLNVEASRPVCSSEDHLLPEYTPDMFVLLFLCVRDCLATTTRITLLNVRPVYTLSNVSRHTER